MLAQGERKQAAETKQELVTRYEWVVCKQVPPAMPAAKQPKKCIGKY